MINEPESLDWTNVHNKTSPGSKLSDFKIVGQLGVGASAVVFKIESLINNKIYVMKRLEQIKNKEIDKEVKILKRLNNKHIIKYYNSFIEDDHLNIIIEYAECGDLHQYMEINQIQKNNIKEEEVWFFTYQILLGLEYLHSNNVIHRDIKLLNIFLNKEKVIKIGDLGVSKLLTSKEKLKSSRVGTPLYIAPEIIQHIPYDYKIDMWSLGCSLYHLITFEPPFDEKDLLLLGAKIIRNEPTPLPDIYSKELRDFIFILMSKNPSFRPTAKEALFLIPVYIKVY